VLGAVALLNSLGTAKVIEYKMTCIPDIVRNIDIDFGTSRRKTRNLSSSVLELTGRMITVAADGEVAQIRASKITT
jgi:hypothetical protein